MRSFLLCALCALVACALAYESWAIDDDSAATDDDDSAQGAAEAPALEDLPAEVGKVTDAFKGGALPGITALVAFLIWLLRLPLIRTLMTTYQVKPYKPIIAAALGGVLAFLVSHAAGLDMGVSVSAGIVAGLGATGLHQAVEQLADRIGKWLEDRRARAK